MSESSNNGFGVVTGTASALAFPEANADWMRIKAYGANASEGYIGTMGNAVFPLSASNDTGWFAVEDTSELFYRGAGLYFAYWFQN